MNNENKNRFYFPITIGDRVETPLGKGEIERLYIYKNKIWYVVDFDDGGKRGYKFDDIERDNDFSREFFEEYFEVSNGESTFGTYDKDEIFQHIKNNYTKKQCEVLKKIPFKIKEMCGVDNLKVHVSHDPEVPNYSTLIIYAENDFCQDKRMRLEDKFIDWNVDYEIENDVSLVGIVRF
jgi:hypothetical protein